MTTPSSKRLSSLLLMRHVNELYRSLGMDIASLNMPSLMHALESNCDTQHLDIPVFLRLPIQLC